MKRIKGIVAAGTLTGLILITVVVLGIGNVNATGESAVFPTVAIQAQPVDGLGSGEAVQAWQDYSAELENTVTVFQERETTYQTQLEAANDTILS